MADQPPSSLSPQQRAERIAREVLARRRAGEVVTDDQIYREHPDLLGYLRPALEKVRLIGAVTGQANQAVGQLTRDLLAEPDVELPEDFADSSFFGAAAPPSPSRPAPQWKAPAAPVGDAAQDTADELDDDRITMDEEDFVREVGAQYVERPRDRLTVQDLGASPDLVEGRAPAIKRTLVFQDGPSQGGATRFRPAKRPPMAILRVFDDNQFDNEVVRMRGAHLVIGRDAGDVVVSHDPQMSHRHASITREERDGFYRWVLRDLDSTNGVFVMAQRGRLKKGDLLLIANRLLRFVPETGSQPPRLDELYQGTSVQRLDLLDGEEYWLGRAPGCAPLMEGEPMLDAKHARVARDEKGRWTLWNNDSTNGVWVRVSEIRLIHHARFQLGEQRFGFEIP